MPDSDRDFRIAVGRIVTILFGMLIIGGAVAFYQSASAIYPRREALYEAAERRCTEDNSQSCQEMYAAIRSARAAEDTVDLGVWQFIAGLVGIYLIARTLKATRDAVTEANDATNAARHAVDITEDTARRQLRAYVVAEPGEITEIDSKKGIHVAVEYQNVRLPPTQLASR